MKINVLKTILIASVCLFASTNYLDAQNNNALNVWLPAGNLPGGYVQVGKMDASTDPYNDDNTLLTLGGGHASNNVGLYNIRASKSRLIFGRAYNMLNSNDLSYNYGKYALVLGQGGGVGINKYAPNEYQNNVQNVMLDVEGYIRSNIGYLTGSDSRYKRNVQPISSIEKLFKLNAVQYNPSGEATAEQLEIFKKEFKDKMSERDYDAMIESMENQIIAKNSDTSLHFGFIAQDLREVFPNLVGEDEQGFLSVNYTELIPVLVDVVKEQQKQINYLLGKGKGIDVESFNNDALLYQNNPNPFSEKTEIKFYVPESSSNAFICIYDMTGSELMKLNVTKGYASVTINGSQLKAGMYLYSLIVDGKEVDTKRMILTNN
ncbi:MAG: tail fiber domain-containing protein [Bacteroidetes bacterium]|nr:tail fiber domain-containing protein [Bacteroidota bacterium]